MNFHLIQTLFVALLLLVVGGCASLPVKGQIAPAITVTRIATARVPFMPDASGSRIAFVFDGFKVRDMSVGQTIDLHEETPDAIAWNQEGTHLAASFYNPDGTSDLLVFSATGTKVAQTLITGRTGGLFWSRSRGILALAVRFKSYSFGTTVTQVLHQWDLASEPVSQEIHDTTMKPKTFNKIGERLFSLMQPSLSKYEDELVYARFHEPPQFPLDRRFVARHLESGAEKEIVVLPPDAGTVVALDRDDIFAVVDDLKKGISLINPWSRAVEVMPANGRLAASRTENIAFVENRLYRGREEVARFDASVDAVRFSTSGRIYVLSGGTLFAVDGVSSGTTKPTPSDEGLDRLLTLRAWRARGLITVEDFETALGRIK